MTGGALWQAWVSKAGCLDGGRCSWAESFDGRGRDGHFAFGIEGGARGEGRAPVCRGMRLHKLLDRQPAAAGGSSRRCVWPVGNGGPGGSDGVRWKSGSWGQGSLGSVRARPHLTYCKGFAMKLAIVAALETSKLQTFKITLFFKNRTKENKTTDRISGSSMDVY